MGTNYYVYNIITNILIKHALIDLGTCSIKHIPGNNSKNKLQQYLNNFK
uniref:Uncharacterized protein n=1 Tax=Moumouvirus sp. 'Monve' TaxID=1128131 RepID=H2ED66_9VIRU|nr:hypothetical protein mv_L134 [Moumouvirus Monve]